MNIKFHSAVPLWDYSAVLRALVSCAAFPRCVQRPIKPLPLESGELIFLLQYIFRICVTIQTMQRRLPGKNEMYMCILRFFLIIVDNTDNIPRRLMNKGTHVPRENQAWRGHAFALIFPKGISNIVDTVKWRVHSRKLIYYLSTYEHDVRSTESAVPLEHLRIIVAKCKTSARDSEYTVILLLGRTWDVYLRNVYPGYAQMRIRSTALYRLIRK